MGVPGGKWSCLISGNSVNNRSTIPLLLYRVTLPRGINLTIFHVNDIIPRDKGVFQFILCAKTDQKTIIPIF